MDVTALDARRFRVQALAVEVENGSGGAAGPATLGPAMERLVHDVYFTLNDSSPGACQALVDLCHEHLPGHDGIVFFAAGTRQVSHQRDVNDDGFDVSLHICFESKAAHDVYQDTEAHQRFIDAGSGNWTAVRVFDSMVRTV